MGTDINIRNHFNYMLHTHDVKRAVTLTALIFKVSKEKVEIVCKDIIDDNTFPKVIE